MNTVQNLLPSYLLTAECDETKRDIPSYIYLEPWEDGFRPSAYPHTPCRIVKNLPRSNPELLEIIDHAISKETADLLYRSACDSKVWGHFIYKSELSFSKKQTFPSHTISNPFINSERDQKELCRRAIEEFVSKAKHFFTDSEWEYISGVSVWVIASDVGHETAYHLDYAESVRYETNVIVPPLYSATIHISPFEMHTMKGGDLYVNVRGLRHYRSFGYKSRLMSMDEKKNACDGWVMIPYVYRRGILFNGEFPHLSTRIEALPPLKRKNSKRVIVGFNFISPEIASFVHAFPEHSKAFNKHIRLSQAAMRTNESEWTMEALRNDKRKAKFICQLARKLKERNDKK